MSSIDLRIDHSYDRVAYLGRIDIKDALEAQAATAARITAGGRGRVFGFECEPVVTLGLRGRSADDVPGGVAELVGRGIDLVRVDRGGQATLHNPGQLVIFPVWRTGAVGSRAWVEYLIACTRTWAARRGIELFWRADAPGLYDANGAKVVALGVRIRRGVSTHGLAINVRNDLRQFELIRPCGRPGSTVAHLKSDAPLPRLFDEWSAVFLKDAPTED